MNFESLVDLGVVAATANKQAKIAYSYNDKNYSTEEVNKLLRKELNELAGTYAKFRENKNTIFALIEEVVDTVLPQRVLEQYGDFAEIKTFAQGDKAIFKEKITAASRRRAKRFVTRVGLAGVYEVFKLDGSKYELLTTAYGGAVQIGFEEFLDGNIEMSDVLDILLEGLDEAVYREIAKAMSATSKYLPSVNIHTEDGFNEQAFDNLISIADSYGQSAIYCTYEFAATVLPNKDWASEKIKDQRWENGYVTSYKSHKIVVLKQSYEDETNTVKVMDPSIAFIIPVGKEKIVKIAFEGQTAVKEVENEDWSREIRSYKKFGVGVPSKGFICCYKNTALDAIQNSI